MPRRDPVAVFVLHWNQPQACLETLEALRAQTVPMDITVVDNGSAKQELARLRQGIGDAIRIVCLPVNRGWGAAFNTVLREWLEGAGEYCVLSAHDALVSRDCIEKLARALDGESTLGMVCPEYGDGGVVRYSKLRGLHVRTATRKPADTVEWMPAPHGTLVMCRRRCLESSGLFDERFFAYGDEVEIGLRAGRHGWGSAMVWGAHVVNPATSTPSAAVGYLAMRNGLLISRLHSGAAWAFLRMLLKLATGVRGQHGTWRAPRVWRARIRGLIDFARGRFGPPPAQLL